MKEDSKGFYHEVRSGAYTYISRPIEFVPGGVVFDNAEHEKHRQQSRERVDAINKGKRLPQEAMYIHKGSRQGRVFQFRQRG